MDEKPHFLFSYDPESAFATIWNPVFASCTFATLHWESPWHSSLLYYLSAFCLCHVPLMPYGNFCMYSTKTVLSCVGFFKETTVMLLQDPQQYGGIFRDQYLKLWKSRKKRKKGREVRREKRRTFRLTFGDRHCEIKAMAFQLSQIIFRIEMTNCNRELQFPPLIIYFS